MIETDGPYLLPRDLTAEARLAPQRAGLPAAHRGGDRSARGDRPRAPRARTPRRPRTASSTGRPGR
jgi:hypothetical protein